MKTMIFLAAVIAQLALGSQALAQSTPAPPPDPYTAPPPAYGAAPAYGVPTTPQTAYLLYDAQRRNVGLAILIEFFVPGLGSLYGDHGVGALITWGVMLGGIALVIVGATQFVNTADQGGQDNTAAGTEVGVGIAMILGGRIYGLIDSYLATDEYNRKLRQKLGLPAGLSLGIGRVGSGPATALGPKLSFTF
jgi:hypothetical protein